MPKMHPALCALAACLLVSACAVTPATSPPTDTERAVEAAAPAVDWAAIAKPFESAAAEGVTVSVAPTGGLDVVIPAADGFETASALLRPALQSSLDALVAPLQAQPTLQALIVGHTDSIGREGYNMLLSRKRARAVRDYLMAAGIDPMRLTAEGRGETEPVADNDTPEGRSRNRRVEIRLFLPR
ncbi:OmpA family protein [Nitrogeniibacter mangrovi]|uniref:OmpA family protein n=1 Tax=Nitrogeniibacter mangrovi TaxID=2016596 RepID=A0A6C1B996_9RHOO|nr:OmpA family protein [Nitrogeniibacter mangrovi]QID18910.1 OmpA family protein [Nitrogeniibacter mangrovi]